MKRRPRAQAAFRPALAATPFVTRPVLRNGSVTGPPSRAGSLATEHTNVKTCRGTLGAKSGESLKVGPVVSR